MGGSLFTIVHDYGLGDAVEGVLAEIQRGLYVAAEKRMAERTHRAATWAEFAERLESESGFFLVPWHDDAAQEAAIKEETRATLRAYPLEGQEEARGRACFRTGRPATHMAVFARAY